MRFSSIAVAAASVAGVSAGYNSTMPAYTTSVVTAFTTYCPASTMLTHNGVTYTVTSATTLTITNCPCTITYPVVPVTSVAPPPVIYTNATTVAPVTPVVPVTTTAPPAPVVPVTSGVAKPTTVAVAPVSTFTGAANKAMVASGAGLAGLLGMAAYIL